jgi:hypothetical protein
MLGRKQRVTPSCCRDDLTDVSVTIQPAGNYAGLLPMVLGHVAIVYAGNGSALELPHGSSLSLTEFGVIVVAPRPTPNRFIPYGSILEIVESPVPSGSGESTSPAQPSPDDGQVHD